MKRRTGLAALLAAPLATGMTPVRGQLHRLRPGDDLKRAVAAAADGDMIELEAGLYRGQTAVITQRRLALRAVGGRAVLQAEGADAEGKALIVVRGGQVSIEGIEFRGARVPAGNGAGMRFERGSLKLRRCAFFDNEMGLLSANEPGSDLLIEDCEFARAPHHEGLLHHLLYVGTMRSLIVRGCRFSGGWRGHLLKSRAVRHLIVCNQLDDGEGGEASYEIDLPQGGLAWVLGNVIGQSNQPQNPALIAFGAEGPAHADSALFVAHNSFVNRADGPAAFVRHWPERLPPDTEVRLLNNLMFGHAIESAGQRIEQGNAWRPLSDWDRGHWPGPGLRDGSPALPAVAAAPVARGMALAPDRQIDLPLGSRPLPAPERWRPGAFQH